MTFDLRYTNPIMVNKTFDLVTSIQLKLFWIWLYSVSFDYKNVFHLNIILPSKWDYVLGIAKQGNKKILTTLLFTTISILPKLILNLIIYPTRSWGSLIIDSTTTTTTGGYFAIQISSQTTKKDVSEIPCCEP